jgi:hypothetical protein
MTPLYLIYVVEYQWGGHKEVTAVIGIGVPLARASAAAIKINCAFILLTVLRNFLSWIRGTWVGTYLPVDKNISFHKGIAWTIAALATAHICSHYYNYYSISSGDLQALKNIRIVAGDAAANPTPNDLCIVYDIIQILFSKIQ